METFLLTGDPGDLEPWAVPYIEPAIRHPIWGRYNVLATEYRLADLTRSIGGSFDALLQNKKTEEITLLDFKSQRNPKASTYSIAAQGGGYIHLLQQHHPIIVNKIIGFWLRPGSCAITRHEPDPSVALYQDLRDRYLETNVPF